MKYPQQRGALTGRREFRYGSGEFPKPGGMNTDSNPSAIAPWEFVQAVNVDFRDNDVVERPGYTKINPTELHNFDARHHPTQFDFGTPFRLWLSGDGCPGQSAGTGFYLGTFDFDQEPLFQRAGWFQTAVTSLRFAGYGGIPYLGIDDKLYRTQLIPVPYGQENIGLSGEPAIPLHTFTGHTIRFLQEFDGLLFIGLNDRIATYDGRTVKDGLTGASAADLSGLASAPTAAGLWRDSMIVGFPGAAAEIRLRARGVTPSWTTVAAPGMATAVGNSITSYKDRAYFADGATSLWRYDGTGAPTNVRTPAGATLMEAVGTGEDDAGGRHLFYGYGTGTKAIIGRYDNTTFIDIHKDLQLQLSTARRVKGLRWFKNHLFASVSTTTTGGFILHSPGPITNGVWTLITLAVAANGDVHCLEVI